MVNTRSETLIFRNGTAARDRVFAASDQQLKQFKQLKQVQNGFNVSLVVYNNDS